MAKTPQRIFIKPKPVDAGRGSQLATVPYPPVAGGRGKVLPPDGAWVSIDGTAGSYWTRRINEGSVAKAEPPPVAKPEPAKAEAEPPKQPAAPEHGKKKDGKD